MKSRKPTKNVHNDTKISQPPVRVLAFGTFDVLHVGHVHYLEHAKQLGDELIVIVARDATVKKLKGNFPVQSEKTRVRMANSIKCVDRAVLGNQGNIFLKVREINPDIIAMGYDQKPPISVVKMELAKIGFHPQIVRLKPYRKSEHKSSLLKEKIAAHHQQNSKKIEIAKGSFTK